MELWIRSQDKESLVRTDYKLMITNVPTEKYSGREGYRITSDFYVVGIYKTKERALEVLDEIQTRIINLQLVGLEEKGQARKDARINDELKCIYEMPEE